MPNKPESTPGAFDLLSRFTQLRQNGVNRDEAWYQIVDNIPDLNDTTRNAFLALAKDWERREGNKYRYRDKSNHVTVTAQDVKPVAQTQPNPPQAKQQVATPPPARPMLTGQLDPSRLTAHNQQRLEQVLDQLEDDDEIDLAIQPIQKPTPPPSYKSGGGTALMRHADDFFGPKTTLLFYFKNFPKPLRVTIAGNDELFIGRATANTAMAPEIDLNAVNAGDYGVSRIHAAITRRENKLLITDLESMNYTYVNGMRLFPNEVYILKDGDEIWFGQLYAKIRFQHQ